MEFLQFDKLLEKNTADYTGEHEFVIRNSGKLYRSLTRLISDNELPKDIRAKLFAVIGYFVIPNDFYSEEEHGPIGYIDDLILVIFIFREILKIESFEKLESVWEGSPEELKQIIEVEFENIIDTHLELYKELIEFMEF